MESTSPSLLTTDNTLERSFFIRMKSTLTKRGVHIKSSGYKVSWAAAGERLLSRVNPRSLALGFPAALGPSNQYMWSGAAHRVLSYLPVSSQGIHHTPHSHFRQCWCPKCLSECLSLKHMLIMYQVLQHMLEIHFDGQGKPNSHQSLRWHSRTTTIRILLLPPTPSNPPFLFRERLSILITAWPPRFIHVD